MVNRIVVPTLLVAAGWVVVGVSTTVYVLWLDASYQVDFQQHVSCTESAGALAEHLWHLQADLGQDVPETAEWLQRVRRVTQQIQDDVTTIASSAGPPEHDRLVREVQELVPRYLETLQGLAGPPTDIREEAALRRPAELLAERAHQLRELHHELLRQASVSRDSVTAAVLWIRGIVLFIGPLLGWWMASHLGRVVNEIRVTLESSSDLFRDNVGAIRFRTGDDLTSIRQQVEVIVERLKHTAEELKQANHEVLRSDRLAAIGRLAAGVAHELRNPLTSVKLLIQYAVTAEDRPLTNEQLQLILEEVERMESTIQGLLDLSRTAPIHRTQQDLRESLARAAQLVSGRATRQQVTIHTDSGTEPLTFVGDVQELHQVLVNLYFNAMESMSQGGTLRIRAWRLSDRPVIRIEVRDTGPGIRPEILPRLFEPFVTSKERGTGLGLAISQRIIEAHGGNITAANASDGGTVS